MRKRVAILCFLLALFVFALASAENTGAINLLENGGFEVLDSSGDPVGWYPSAYRTQEGYSRITISSEQAHAGQYSAMVENASANDARFVYTAKVESNSMYKLSGYVLVERMDIVGNGANFGIENIYSFSDCLFDTNSEWKYLEWYGETGENQHELTFGVRVGGYGAESIGKAYFDDLVLERVDELPREVIASLWYDDDAGQAASSATDSQSESKSTAIIILCGIAYLVMLLLVRPLLSKKSSIWGGMPVFALVLLAAFVMRVALAISVPGYEVDINCFTAWSLRMASTGPAGFYAPDYFCDYPPGYLLLLWPCGLVLRAVGPGSEWSLLIVKSIPILCDIAGAICLYAFSKKRLGELPAIVIASLYALNPAVLVNGAAWGQVDSLLALLLLITAIGAMDQKWHIALPLFVVAVLVKPQALLFAPVGGIWLLICLFSRQTRSHEQWKRLGVGAAVSVALAAAIILPFAAGQESPLGWLIALYGETLSSYSYATLNTANLYYLLGANWTPLNGVVSGWLCGATALVFASACTALLLHAKPIGEAWPSRRMVLGMLCGAMAIAQLGLCIFSATYAVYGYAMLAFSFLYAIVCLLCDRRAECLPFYLALALIGVYVLGVKVHERYLFPALVLLFAGYALTRDKRLLVLASVFSVTTFINTAVVLDNAVLFGASQGHLNSDTLFLNVLLCILNISLCFYAGWLGAMGLRQSPESAEEPETLAQPSESCRRMLFAPQDARLHLTRRDWLVMGATTVLYAVLAFANLGSTAAPQTGWVSTSAEEEVVFDLGERKTFSVLYYAGVSYNDFSISISDDGATWTETHPCQMRQGLCFRWMYALRSNLSNGSITYTDDSPANVLWFTGRYLRLNATQAGLNLWEIVARDQNGENLPLTIVSHTGDNPDLLDAPKPVANLIDEQSTCVGDPSWYNGMYFDEIYHARGAYHNLHNESPYETTHPPLGKLMIAAGIALFGMTPFGWRFAGALTGVLMLPALYLLALQITKKRRVATVSMLAFALDLMHFTQTRIATIDSFPVLFILLSLLCMVRYMQTDILALCEGEAPKLFTRAFKRSLIPLMLSGLFMGLGIASKWIGCYSAIGLAVLFFAALFRQYRASNMACSLDVEAIENDGDRQRVLNAQNLTLKRILITCGFCLIFFAAVPLVIYCLSYIPYLTPTGPYTLKRIIQAQEGMLSYHSTPGLGMDHPFQSPWWQWPFMLKPMWFAKDSYETAGFGATIMCMGNPWVFYIGAFSMAGVLIACVLKYVRLRGHTTLKHGDGDFTLPVLCIGFLAQFLPWVLVPRSMYMYHYFASVPFIIMSTAWFMEQLPWPKVRRNVMIAYVLIAAVCFAVFFPFASGYLTPTWWLDAIREWFPKLYY